MLIRLITWIALAVAGFAGGMVAFRDHGDAGSDREGGASLQEWSATQPTAAVVGGDSGGGAGEAMETVLTVA